MQRILRIKQNALHDDYLGLSTSLGLDAYSELIRMGSWYSGLFN